MRLRLFLLLLVALAPLTAAQPSPPSFEVIRPANETFFVEGYASVVIRVNDPQIDRIKLSYDESNASYAIEVNASERTVYCETTSLVRGDNTLQVKVFAKGSEIGSDERFIFRREEVFAGADSEPEGYEKNFFHNDAQETLCKQCHDLAPMPVEYEAPDDVTQISCHQCHKKLLSRKNSHAPSINYLCTQCHSGQAGEHNRASKGASHYLAPDPVMKRCFNCHENIEQDWMSRTSEHGPARSGRCNKCHNPHSSDHEFFLRKGIWDLCTTCHSEKATGKHVVSSFVFSRNGGGHPTKGRPDPSRPGRELVCSGCHNPHGSNGVFLLRTTSKSTFGVCKRCHKK